MDVKSLSDFLNKSNIHTFYPLQFPISAPDGCSYVEFTGGTPERAGVQTYYLRVMTREVHIGIAMDKCKEIKKYLLENLKGASFDDDKEVLMIRTDGPEPYYLGEEDGRHTFSWNYTFIYG